MALLGLPGAAYLYQGQELGLPEVDVPVEARVDPMWARGGVCRDGARVPLPWTEDAALNHGFSLGAIRAAASRGCRIPAGWGTHAVELQEQDPESALNLTKAALELRRQLWKNEVFTADDGGTWRVEAGNLLICERNEHFLVAVAMGTEPVKLPAGTVLLSAAPLAEDGWLQPNNAAWVLGAEAIASRRPRCRVAQNRAMDPKGMLWTALGWSSALSPRTLYRAVDQRPLRSLELRIENGAARGL